jgi:hypothetical protein
MRSEKEVRQKIDDMTRNLKTMHGLLFKAGVAAEVTMLYWVLGECTTEKELKDKVRQLMKRGGSTRI